MEVDLTFLHNRLPLLFQCLCQSFLLKITCTRPVFFVSLLGWLFCFVLFNFEIPSNEGLFKRIISKYYTENVFCIVELFQNSFYSFDDYRKNKFYRSWPEQQILNMTLELSSTAGQNNIKTNKQTKKVHLRVNYLHASTWTVLWKRFSLSITYIQIKNLL